MNWQQACELPYYGGSDLGANPAAEETVFQAVGTHGLRGRSLPVCNRHRCRARRRERGVHELHREADGVWAITLPGNLHGTYYLYRVYFPDGRMQEVVDPYARSAGANGQRGMVLDLTRAAPEGLGRRRAPRHTAPRPQRVGGACGGLLRRCAQRCAPRMAREIHGLYPARHHAGR